MGNKLCAMLLFLLFAGCGAYKELKPNPAPIARQLGYIQLLNKDKKFEIKKDKKYFMVFPATQGENTYLALKVSDEASLSTYLTRQFTKGKNDVRMNDESEQNDNLNVYTLGNGLTTYTWVIDQVYQDMVLDLEYRYVPIWRFRFEQKEQEFRGALTRNRADQPLLESIGVSRQVDDIDFGSAISRLGSATKNLERLQGELKQIEGILPSNVINSDDRAYLDYLGLRRDIEKELVSHQQHRAALRLFDLEKSSRGNGQSLTEAVPEFMTFFNKKDAYPSNVVSEAQRLVGGRLGDLGSYYETALRDKNDIAKINLPTRDAEALFAACNRQPDSKMSGFISFIDMFNRDAAAINGARAGLTALSDKIRNAGSWPSDDFYLGLQREAGRLRSSLPTTSGDYGTHRRFRCVSLLNNETRNVSQEISNAAGDFQRAAELVPQINRYRDQDNYRGAIQLLDNNRDLAFLLRHYADIDDRSIEQQARQIQRALDNSSWAQADGLLQQLYRDNQFLDLDSVRDKKLRRMKALEETFVSTIERESKQRIDTFIEQNKAAINNVEGLYNSPAFSPVHVLTFSSGGQNVVDLHNKKVQDYLDGFKFDKFPRMSIEAIYRDFVSDITKNGVAKAKAVNVHGRYYRGDDRKIKNLISECDPTVPKWITKAREYRKIYVVPVNDAQKESNQYMFRLNLQVPSDATFPVFDVNMKLPREVANRAGEQQWYEKMTLNGNVLKNEGRFTIIAPTADNNFECQVTPLRVNKDGNNILEVRFNHSAFKVLEVSVMAQKPIIRKN